MIHNITLNELTKKTSYSNEETSSTIVMYTHSSSIRPEFVGLIDGERPINCDRDSTSYDFVELSSVGLSEGKRTNDVDMRSTFDDELDNLVFLDGLGIIIQSVGSMLLSSTSNRFLMSLSFNSESTKMTGSFVLKCVMLTYKVTTIISLRNNNGTIFNP
jgi:hypothetical protein